MPFFLLIHRQVKQNINKNKVLPRALAASFMEFSFENCLKLYLCLLSALVTVTIHNSLPGKIEINKS